LNKGTDVSRELCTWIHAFFGTVYGTGEIGMDVMLNCWSHAKAKLGVFMQTILEN